MATLGDGCSWRGLLLTTALNDCFREDFVEKLDADLGFSGPEV